MNDSEEDRRIPPQPPRRQDIQTRTRLDDIHDGYKTWGRRSLIILGIIAIMMASIGAADLFLWGHVKDNTERNRANAISIENSRVATELTRCHDQNTNHDAASAKLEIIIQHAVKKGQISEKTAESVQAQNQALLDALAPHQDCAARVKQLTGVITNG